MNGLDSDHDGVGRVSGGDEFDGGFTSKAGLGVGFLHGHFEGRFLAVWYALWDGDHEFV